MLGLTISDERRILEANDAFLALLARTREELEAGLDWHELTAPEWRAADAAALEQLRTSGASAAYGKECLHADGHRFSVRLASGGHPPPFVTRTGGAVEKVAVTGTMLGVCEDPRLDEVLVELRPGDALVMYTDGVTDARRSGGERFGEQRLLEALRRGAGASAAEQASGVEQAVLAHHLGAASDDRALVALRALG